MELGIVPTGNAAPDCTGGLVPAIPLSTSGTEAWEQDVRVWLSSLPCRRNPTIEEVEAWIGANEHRFPDRIRSSPRESLYQRVFAIHDMVRGTKGKEEVEAGNYEPKSYQFQRSDMWKPVYSWLQSLNKSEIVQKSEIVRWLSENPAVRDELESRNARYSFMHYIQKLHKKLLKRRGKYSEARRRRGRPRLLEPLKAAKSEPLVLETVHPGRPPTNLSKKSSLNKEKAFVRYQLLSELKDRLIALL